jgi:AraC family transcriptional regulator
MNSAVERAIECICERYSEPLSLADVARSAILSRFHFSRLFRDTTGVTPGRFLSAVRIYQAKRMLLNSSLSITDISFAVGYNSLGSFSNHFTDSVGLSPGRFRRISQQGMSGPPRLPQTPSPLDGTVTGMITLPRGYAGVSVYVGAFDTPIVQRRPACATIVQVPSAAQAASYHLGCVPAGTWFIHAVAVADSIDPEPWTRRTLLIGGHGPVTVAAGADTPLTIRLRTRQPTDLPILLALPDLEAQLDDLPSAEVEPISPSGLEPAPAAP